MPWSESAGVVLRRATTNMTPRPISITGVLVTPTIPGFVSPQISVGPVTSSRRAGHRDLVETPLASTASDDMSSASNAYNELFAVATSTTFLTPAGVPRPCT